jgi:EmrB/QacA subfamily drug resistance transporter
MEDNKSLQRNALLIAALSSFLTPFMGSSVVISLPAIGHDLSMDAVSLSWISTAFLFSAAAFLVPVGRAADIYGRKKIFIWGIILDNISSILGAMAPSGTFLIICRGLQGMGGAMIFGTGLSIVMAVYPPKDRGKALGIVLTATYIGLTLGPVLGGIMTDHLGWRSIFLSNVVIGLVILITAIWKIKEEWAEAHGERFDFTGSAIYVLSLVLTIYGLLRLPAIIGFALLLPGIAGFVFFVLWISKTKNPVMDIHLFRNNRPFLFSNIAALINYSATFSVTFLISLYLQYIMRFSAQHAGLILVAQPVVMAGFAAITGRLSDRIEPRILASAGMVSLTIGLVFLVFLNDQSTLHYIVLNLMFLGFGFALFIAPNTNAIMSSVEKRFYGVASGIMGTMRLIGQAFSMSIVTLIFTIYIGRTAITVEHHPNLLQSMKTSFVVFAILCFFGIIASLVRGKIRKDEGPPPETTDHKTP